VYYLILPWLFFAAGLFLIGLIAPKQVIMWGTVCSRGCVILNYGFAICVLGMLLVISKEGLKCEKPLGLSRSENERNELHLDLKPDPTHYEMVIEYSNKKNKKESNWNQIAGKLQHTIRLGRANFNKKELIGINLSKAQLQLSQFQEAKLRMANFEGANAGGASFKGKRTNLMYANFRNATLIGTDFRGANLSYADFRGANLFGANLEGAYLHATILSSAKLQQAHMEGALLNWQTDLGGTYLKQAHLERAKFISPKVDGGTYIWDCSVDRKTDFEGVALDSVRIEPGLKQLLEYNVRRNNWEKWYEDHKIIQYPVHLFWWTSDYGLSTLRLLGVFFGSVLLFANIYCSWGLGRDPGIVSRLFENKKDEQIPKYVVSWRALYFSLVNKQEIVEDIVIRRKDSQ